jgi:hypothetical protein
MRYEELHEERQFGDEGIRRTKRTEGPPSTSNARRLRRTPAALLGSSSMPPRSPTRRGR